MVESSNESDSNEENNFESLVSMENYSNSIQK